MMKRSTVSLLIYAGTGGGIMALAAAAVAQAAQPAQPAPHEAFLALLGPSASGVIGALVVACYNQITSFVKQFNARMDKLEADHQHVKNALSGRPCMVEEPCEYQGGDDSQTHRRRTDKPGYDYSHRRRGRE